LEFFIYFITSRLYEKTLPMQRPEDDAMIAMKIAIMGDAK